MNRKPISELRNAHAGSDVWIIAAGPSMDFVSPGFFDGKLTIGINQVWKKFPCSYLVRKDPFGMEEAFQSGIPLILSEFEAANRASFPNSVPGPAYYFDHVQNGCHDVDLSVVTRDSDRIFVSYSTITSAMHVAAYMGARAIILCGHDCGALDGCTTYRGYHDGRDIGPRYAEWITEIEPQTVALKQRLHEVFGCEIVSLNPFVNFGLEGHVYSGRKAQ